jgi:hypothetical protein
MKFYKINKENMSKKETIAVDGIVAEFTTNSNGVRIKKCCASCTHHNPFKSDGPKRLCTLHTTTVDGKEVPKTVDKSDLCREWGISDMMNKIKLHK